MTTPPERRRPLAIALALLLALPAACARPAAAGDPRREGAPRDPVVVAVVVDQLAAWVAAERWPLLPAGGGFARLRREGTWVEQLTYLHAVTETAPGHAALFTGRTPRENGVVANAVWRDDLGRRASPLEDPGQQRVGADGPEGSPGISLARVRVPTLADDLRARDPDAAVVALSLKDRGAAFGGGRRPGASLWYDGATGELVTSTAFAPALPGWASPWARRVARLGELRWDLLDRAFVAAHAGGPDDQPGESDALGGRTFPHVAAEGATTAAFPATPMSDAFLVDVALAALDGARHAGHPTLLAVSLSANDHVGHAFGPDSWEAWDELLRLDATLARLMTGLDARLGPDGWSLLLAGDHGVAPLPEVVAAGRHPWCGRAAPDRFERPCAPGLRLSPNDVALRLDAALQRRLARATPLVAGVDEGFVQLSGAARALPPARAAELARALRDEAPRVPGIAAAVPSPPPDAPCPPPDDERMEALACRSAGPASGPYYLVPTPGSFWWGGAAAGASHGTPWRYDRTVPMLVRLAHGPGGRTVARARFGSYRATAWYALTGEVVDGPYGGPVGLP